MPVLRRYLVRDASGRLVDLPSQAFDRADDGVAPLPDFAGRCVDLVSAVLVAERGAAPRVAEVAFTKIYFDQSGFVDAAKRDRMIQLMLESCADRRCRTLARAAAGPSDGPCADLHRRAHAARNLLDSEFAWKPAPAEVDLVLDRLAPHHRAAPAGATLH